MKPSVITITTHETPHGRDVQIMTENTNLIDLSGSLLAFTDYVAEKTGASPISVSKAIYETKKLMEAFHGNH